MLNIDKINNSSFYIPKKCKVKENTFEGSSLPMSAKYPNFQNLQAYHPSFGIERNKNKADKVQNEQLKQISSLIDSDAQAALSRIQQKGILNDNSSNDGSTVLDNLYKIASEPRIQGLDTGIILKEVINALDNPSSITQKFGDIPDIVAQQITAETGEEVPEEAKHVASSSCVVASMEYNLASRTPAEFVRFAEGLSSQNYSVDKNIKMSDIADGMATGLWMLREFNTESQISSNWEDVTVKIKPDRNAIVRARMQTSYKDENERSCVDVLIQSALLNLGSQHTYNSITDKRTGKFNADNEGLTDFEKTFTEEVVFGTPKISVVYQNLDENGKLLNYNCEPSETKQHILNSLNLGQNVIVGYTHFNGDNQVDGGHEITIIGYEEDRNGQGWFICNDTDDDLNEPIKVQDDKLIKLIHHAGIPKEALNEQDIVVPAWREILEEFKNMLNAEQSSEISAV